MPRLDEARPFIVVRFAILTVSDSRDLASDRSGDTLQGLIIEGGHQVSARVLVRDDIETIQSTIRGFIADPAVDVVVTTGGTGFTGRDVTPEAVIPLFDKTMDGFATIFHMLSYQKIETSTLQSRACAGLSGSTYIFCLPGSPGACRDAWDGILKWQFDNRHRPCNFVEIMPRLTEHLRPTQAG